MIALRDEIYEFSSKGKNSSCLKVGARPKGSINSGAQSPQYFSAWGLTFRHTQVIHVKQICPSPAPSPSLSPELSAPSRPTAPLAPAPAQGGTGGTGTRPGRGRRGRSASRAQPPARRGRRRPLPPSAGGRGARGGPGGPGPRVPVLVPVPGGAGVPGACSCRSCCPQDRGRSGVQGWGRAALSVWCLL